MSTSIDTTGAAFFWMFGTWGDEDSAGLKTRLHDVF